MPACFHRTWLLLLAVLPLCLSAAAGRVEVPDDPAPVVPLSEEAEVQAPSGAPEPARFDYSRYFAPEEHAEKAATNIQPEENPGFVEPLDFSRILGSSGAFGPNKKNRKEEDSPPFSFGRLDTEASNSKNLQSFPSFGTPFGLQADASAADVGFRPEDFIKSKRGASEQALAKDNSFFSPNFFGGENDYTSKDYQPTKYVPHASASETQDASHNTPKKDSFDDDFSFANFEKDEEDDDDDERKYRGAGDGADDDDDDDGDGPSRATAATSKHKEKNARYPSYSSYYHSGQPAQGGHGDREDDDAEINEKSSEDGDFGLGADEVGAPEKLRGTPASSASSNEAYNSRPRLDSAREERVGDYKYDSYKNSPKNARPSLSGRYTSQEAYKEPLTGAYGPGPSATSYDNQGPAKFDLHGGFRPSPIDPLYGKVPSSPELSGQGVSPFNPGPAHYKVGAASAQSRSSSSPSQSAANKSNCRKVHKQVGVGPPSGMSCFVCDDPKTGGSFEQCAYGSEPISRAYYVGRSEAFTSDKDKPYTFRRRRYLTVGPAPEASDDVEALTRHSREEPDDEFFGFSGAEQDDKDEYRFGPEYFDHEEDEKTPSETAAQSESQATPSAQSNEKCEKKVKKGSVCMVCTDPNTGGNYEQCQYTDKPETQSYSFGRSSSYGSPSPERHRRYIENGDGGKNKGQQSGAGKKQGKATGATSRQQHSTGAKTAGSKSAPLRKRKDQSPKTEDVPYIGAEYEIPSQQARSDSKEEPKESLVEALGLDSSSLYGPDEPFGPPAGLADQADLTEPAEQGEQEDQGDQTEQVGNKEAQGSSNQGYDDYFSFLFPELSTKNKANGKVDNIKKKKKAVKKKKIGKQDPAEEGSDEVGLIGKFEDDHFTAESKDDKAGFLIADYFTDPGPKKDLEKMLGEFTQKDRSDCKKVEKDHMTCFQCIDKKGMQHEECMFVAGSEPKKSHLAYHESTEYKKKPTTTAPLKTGVAASASTTSGASSDARDTSGAASTDAVGAAAAQATSASAPAPVRRAQVPGANKLDKRTRGEKKFKISDLTTPIPAPAAAGAANAARSRQQRGLPESKQVYRRAAGSEQPAQRQKPQEKQQQPKQQQQQQQQQKPEEKQKQEKSPEPQQTQALVQEQESQPDDEEEAEGDGEAEDDHEDMEADDEDEEDDFDEGEGEKSPQKESTEASSAEITTPPGPDGLYSEETKPVYDKVLKLSLPKYMLAKSDSEAIFDEVLASGA